MHMVQLLLCIKQSVRLACKMRHMCMYDCTCQPISIRMHDIGCTVTTASKPVCLVFEHQGSCKVVCATNTEAPPEFIQVQVFSYLIMCKGG